MHMTSKQSAVLPPPRQESRQESRRQTAKRMDNFHFSAYDRGDFYDEMFDDDGSPRSRLPAALPSHADITTDDLARRQKAADRSMVQLGITFNVYGDTQGTERIIPVRHRARGSSPTSEWQWLERGLKQRITALNLFIDDIYHEQKIVRDGVIPEHVVRDGDVASASSASGSNPPRGIWCHITGTDLVRDRDGQYLRAGRQPALPLGRVVRAAESAADEADVSAALRAGARSARSTTIAAGCSTRCST